MKLDNYEGCLVRKLIKYFAILSFNLKNEKIKRKSEEPPL